MDIQGDSAIRQRATRRARVYYLVIGTAVVAGLAFAGVMVGGAVVPLLVLSAVVLFTAGLMVLMVRAVRRRSGSWVSPLLGADRHTRRRVARAIRTGTVLPPDEQRLAVAEATRIRQVHGILTVPFIIAAVLNLIQFAVYLAEGTDTWRIVASGAAAAGFSLLPAHQFFYYRRAGVFLAAAERAEQPGQASS